MNYPFFVAEDIWVVVIQVGSFGNNLTQLWLSHNCRWKCWINFFVYLNRNVSEGKAGAEPAVTSGAPGEKFSRKGIPW